MTSFLNHKGTAAPIKNKTISAKNKAIILTGDGIEPSTKVMTKSIDNTMSVINRIREYE